jgi:hypothetical protein
VAVGHVIQLGHALYHGARDHFFEY